MAPLDENGQRSIETLTTHDNKMVLADMVIIRGLGVEVTTKTPFSMLTSQSEIKGLIGRKAVTNLKSYDQNFSTSLASFAP